MVLLCGSDRLCVSWICLICMCIGKFGRFKIMVGDHQIHIGKEIILVD